MPFGFGYLIYTTRAAAAWDVTEAPTPSKRDWMRFATCSLPRYLLKVCSTMAAGIPVTNIVRVRAPAYWKNAHWCPHFGVREGNSPGFAEVL